MLCSVSIIVQELVGNFLLCMGFQLRIVDLFNLCLLRSLQFLYSCVLDFSLPTSVLTLVLALVLALVLTLVFNLLHALNRVACTVLMSKR